MTAAANAKIVHNSESPWLLASALFPGGALIRIMVLVVGVILFITFRS